MMTFEIQGVEELKVPDYAKLLPNAWKNVKSWWSDRLRNVIAKVWDCDRMIIAVSTWIVGRVTLACAIEYQKETKSCKVTVGSAYAFGTKPGVEKKFGKALHIVLS